MLVDFAYSDTGRVYARDCERWGLDPGRFISDDVMAFNLRVAMGRVAHLDYLADEAEKPPAESPFVEARRKTAEVFGG